MGLLVQGKWFDQWYDTEGHEGCTFYEITTRSDTGSTTLSYDDNGNLTSKEDHTAGTTARSEFTAGRGPPRVVDGRLYRGGRPSRRQRRCQKLLDREV